MVRVQSLELDDAFGGGIYFDLIPGADHFAGFTFGQGYYADVVCSALDRRELTSLSCIRHPFLVGRITRHATHSLSHIEFDVRDSTLCTHHNPSSHYALFLTHASVQPGQGGANLNFNAALLSPLSSFTSTWALRIHPQIPGPLSTTSSTSSTLSLTRLLSPLSPSTSPSRVQTTKSSWAVWIGRG